MTDVRQHQKHTIALRFGETTHEEVCSDAGFCFKLGCRGLLGRGRLRRCMTLEQELTEAVLVVAAKAGANSGENGEEEEGSKRISRANLNNGT